MEDKVSNPYKLDILQAIRLALQAWSETHDKCQQLQTLQDPDCSLRFREELATASH